MEFFLLVRWGSESRRDATKTLKRSWLFLAVLRLAAFYLFGVFSCLQINFAHTNSRHSMGMDTNAERDFSVGKVKWQVFYLAIRFIF